jgi:hypothetical protein
MILTKCGNLLIVGGWLENSFLVQFSLDNVGVYFALLKVGVIKFAFALLMGWFRLAQRF